MDADAIVPFRRLPGNLIQYLQNVVLKILLNRRTTALTKTSLPVSSLQLIMYAGPATERSGYEIILVDKVIVTLRSHPELHRQIYVDTFVERSLRTGFGNAGLVRPGKLEATIIIGPSTFPCYGASLWF